MFCIAPNNVDGNQFSCGRCTSCRIRKRQAWTCRLILEAGTHLVSSFVTFTYNNDHVPFERGEDGAPVVSLRKRHVQLLHKRLRRAGHRLRFFTVGEYGNRTGRPHYHSLYFGLDTDTLSTALRATWEHGHVDVKSLINKQCAYAARYTVKKLTSDSDVRLDGTQEPEFSVMSLKPYIGKLAVPMLVDLNTTRGGAEAIARTGDVARFCRIEGKVYPLDRTMLNGVREYLGIPLLDRERLTAEPTEEEILNVTLEDMEARMVYARKWAAMVERRGPDSRGEVF